MATPNEKLAASLKQLQALQQGGRRVIQSGELSRTHRERLIRQGFLRPVIRGWLICTSPGIPGNTSPWFASFREFCSRYCNQRFGNDWHLSPEQSLLLHAEATAIPPQVVVYSPEGRNNNIQLLFGSSLYDLKIDKMPPSKDLIEREGVRIFQPAAALVRVPEAFFRSSALDVQVVMAGIRSSAELTSRLLDGGQSVVAGRLAGAFRHIGRADVADEIVSAMEAGGYRIRETNPFTSVHAFRGPARVESPIVARLYALWATMRQPVLDLFPTAPGIPADREAYLSSIDDIYVSDAYHSLSIEGYTVSPELIERVRSGAWDPDANEEDRRNRDTLAAGGYWQAFQEVRKTVASVLSGTNPGILARSTHQDWYRELFQPSVAAGIIPASALAGYRNDSVFIRTSRHVPPRWEVVSDAMTALFNLLADEPEPAVRAVLGHWLLGYIHPYPDGNGRMARFLMNVMLASGGYAWTIIRVDDRNEYLDALERASVDADITRFSSFLGKQLVSTRNLTK